MIGGAVLVVGVAVLIACPPGRLRDDVKAHGMGYGAGTIPRDDGIGV